LFAALGDETRLRLMARLSSGGPGSITQLSAKSAVSRQAITKHLRVLSDVGLVRSTRRGRESVWELETKRLADAHAYLDRISEQWDAALDRLRQLVED
jgi:DNA-binding transcriptional ArsR family regulator